LAIDVRSSLTIGRLAKEAGINLETIRYYERQRLVPKLPRTTLGYRMYPPDAVRRLRFISRAQELGFSLREVRELLSLRASPSATSAAVRKTAKAKIADIEAKISCLEAMRQSLRKLAQTCDGCAPVSECPILESLDKEDS
jgi:MerR family copper efflux transcriptional regulator